MALYKIVNINYLASGQKRSLINMDLSVVKETKTERFGLGLNTVPTISSALMIENGSNDIIECEFQSGQQYYSGESAAEYERNRFLKNKTFVIDKRTSDTENAKVNILCCSDCILYPMYDLNSLMIKSPLKRRNGKNQNIWATDGTQDIYAPEIIEDIKNFAGFQDDSVIITNPLDTQNYNLRAKFNKADKNTRHYNVELEPQNDVFVAYKSHENLGVSSYCEYLEEISEGLSVKVDSEEYDAAIKNIYSHEYEYENMNPEGIVLLEQTDRECDYFDGNIFGNYIHAKNGYNSEYETQSNENGDILNAREYYGVINCGNKVYLKYNDNVNHTVSFQEEHNGKTRNITDKKIIKYDYQKIETFKTVRISGSSVHKSNLFSIIIKNNDLKDVSEPKTGERMDIPQIVKKDIENAVVEITRSICPANSQLFKVFFTKKES